MEEFKAVIFKLDSEEYGVDINRVLSIEKEQEIVPVPNTASYIKGIINLRGEVIPVYSLRKKFNRPDKDSDDQQYIIVSIGNLSMALEVDGVDQIHNIEDECLHQAPSIILNEHTGYVDKVLNNAQRLVIIMNIDNLLSDEEISKVEKLINND